MPRPTIPSPGMRTTSVRGPLLAIALLPLGAALLACSGVSGDLASDTGGPQPLIVPTEVAVGSGDGANHRPAGPGRRFAVPPERPGAGPEQATSPAPSPGDDEGDEPVPGPDEPEGLRGVTQTGPREWNVRQRLVDRWEDNPYALASVEASGEGWMLHKVRKGDAYHLGMKNKDIILSVNGRKLNTQAQMLAAYLALKNKKDFEVVFLRNGKQMKHQYHIKG